MGEVVAEGGHQALGGGGTACAIGPLALSIGRGVAEQCGLALVVVGAGAAHGQVGLRTQNRGSRQCGLHTRKPGL